MPDAGLPAVALQPSLKLRLLQSEGRMPDARCKEELGLDAAVSCIL